MGFISWMTCDTGESISNRYSTRGATPAYVLIPEEFGGGCIAESEYEGYGRFGGHDVYALVARWNRPDECNGDDSHDRDIGFDIAYCDRRNLRLRHPIKIASKPMRYEDTGSSKTCPEQGYFYFDKDDEEEEE